MIRNLETHYGSTLTHDDEVSEATIRSNSKNFFSQGKFFGKREHYTFYRGFVIIRTTRQFTGCRPQRVTLLYGYYPNLEGRPNLLMVSEANPTSIQQAKKMVDYILQTSKLPHKETTNRQVSVQRP